MVVLSGSRLHTDKAAVALWEAAAFSTANTAGRLGGGGLVANPAPLAPHLSSSWLKSVSVPLGSVSLGPTEIICKAAGVRRRGPALSAPPHLLTRRSAHTWGPRLGGDPSLQSEGRRE